MELEKQLLNSKEKFLLPAIFFYLPIPDPIHTWKPCYGSLFQVEMDNLCPTKPM